MKKFISSTLAIAVACAAALAAPVDVATARTKAQRYLAEKVLAGKIMAPGATDAKLIKTEMGDNASTLVYYIFNTATAFVIVSGDDRAEEVLAVGDRPLYLNHIPCNMQAWLYNYLLTGDDTYLATSDVDGDGEVTTVDITCIYNILLGN